MKTTTTILTAAAAAFMLTSGAALAAPGKGFSGHGYGKPGYTKSVKHRRGLSPGERVVIARSAKKLAVLKRRARRDGRVTMRERFQIRAAERRHAALVRRSYRR